MWPTNIKKTRTMNVNGDAHQGRSVYRSLFPNLALSVFYVDKSMRCKLSSLGSRSDTAINEKIHRTRNACRRAVSSTSAAPAVVGSLMSRVAQARAIWIFHSNSNVHAGYHYDCAPCASSCTSSHNQARPPASVGRWQYISD